MQHTNASNPPQLEIHQLPDNAQVINSDTVKEKRISLDYSHQMLHQFQTFASSIINTHVFPFESETVHEIPAGLYFHILAQKLNISGERAVVVLILIERLCSKASNGSAKSHFYKRDLS